MAAFLPLRVLAELVNIGTLMAFSVVCISVLVLRRTRPDEPRPFRCPAVGVVAPAGISKQEEQVLEQTFPEYAQYRTRTKRFIPGVI